MAESITKAFGDQMQRLARRKAPLAERTGPTGGYLVPLETVLRLETLLREPGVFHRYALQQPMASAVCRVPAFDLALGQFGGLVVTWIGEAEEKPEAFPSATGPFWKADLYTKELVARVVVSDQLIADGGEPLGAYLEAAFAACLAQTVDTACFQGPAAPEPLTRPVGVLNAPACLTGAGPAEMLGKLHPACYVGALWAAHPTALATLAADPGYHPAVDVEQPALAGILYGRPLIATAALPADGLVLFDPTKYVLGTRFYEILASPHPLFTTNQTVFRLVWRGDGGPRVNAAVDGMSAYVKKGP